LREELAGLIEKYNKQFYSGAQKPNIERNPSKKDIKESKYKDKCIINPFAVPNPGGSEGNFSWMYLMSPHYN
jgi:hypothetical protein